jgi:hypothetical protein
MRPFCRLGWLGASASDDLECKGETSVAVDQQPESVDETLSRNDQKEQRFLIFFLGRLKGRIS